MNKTQLVEAIALDANITKVDARKAVDALIRATVQALREGERVTLTDLVHSACSTRRHGWDGIPARVRP